MDNKIESVHITSFDTYVSVFVHRGETTRHYQVHGYQGWRRRVNLLKRAQAMQLALTTPEEHRKPNYFQKGQAAAYNLIAQVHESGYQQGLYDGLLEAHENRRQFERERAAAEQKKFDAEDRAVTDILSGPMKYD